MSSSERFVPCFGKGISQKNSIAVEQEHSLVTSLGSNTVKDNTIDNLHEYKVEPTTFNRSILNDIRRYVVSNISDYNLTHEQIDELIYISYALFLQNKYSIHQNDLKLQYKNEFIEYFNKFYKDFLFLTIAAIVDIRTNNLPRESFNMILAYDNVIEPIGVNCATFPDNNDEVKALRKRLEEKWKLK